MYPGRFHAGTDSLSRVRREACYQFFWSVVSNSVLEYSEWNQFGHIQYVVRDYIFFLQSYNLDYSENGVPSVK